MTTNKRTERLQVELSSEDLRAVDDFRFEHRMPNRSAAVRELLKRGLEAAEMNEPDKKLS